MHCHVRNRSLSSRDTGLLQHRNRRFFHRARQENNILPRSVYTIIPFYIVLLLLRVGLLLTGDHPECGSLAGLDESSHEKKPIPGNTSQNERKIAIECKYRFIAIIALSV
jgi:hypothetical protein